MGYVFVTGDLTVIGTKEKVLELMIDEFDLFCENRNPEINFKILRKSELKIKEFLNQEILIENEPSFNLSEEEKQIEQSQAEGKTIAEEGKQLRIKKEENKYKNTGILTLINKVLKDRNKAEAVSINQIIKLTSLTKKQIEKPIERMLKADSIYRIMVEGNPEYFYYGSKSESREITHEIPKVEKASVGRNADPNGPTVRIFNFINNKTYEEALSLSSIMKILNLRKDQASEPLRRLVSNNKISRRKTSEDINSRYLYYKFSNKKQGDGFCLARSRNINLDDCVPNKDNPDCQKCEILNKKKPN